jgi:predicted nucleic acid-binding protein
MAIVDASVLVALFHTDEPHHDACRSWFLRETSAHNELSTPVIALAEVAAAISRGKDNPLRSQQIVSLIRQTNVITLLPVSQSLALQAASIAAVYQIRGCDAVYVALAQKLSQPLVTLDNQQRDRAKALIQVENP